jgi:hypothetical protein
MTMRQQTCHKCQTIPLEWPQKANLRLFPHHENFSALDASAAAGCQLCRLFRQTLLFETNFLIDLQKCAAPIEVHIGASNIVVTINNPKAVVAYAYGSLEVVPESVALSSSAVDLRSKILYLLLRPFARKGESDQILLDFTTSTYQSDLDHLLRTSIQPWMYECCSLSSQKAHRPLPTRVIDVQSPTDPNIKLVETGNQNGIYLILSYCWGQGNNRAKTTRKNQLSRQSAILLSSLPKTIRDAITLTRALGVRYLWVDAICIIQAENYPALPGELDDWYNEAPRMGDYYHNAFCTIGATAATNSEAGLFAERASLKYPVERCLVGKFQDDAAAYVCPSRPSAIQQVAYAPLYARGWTHQERFLSRHILHFSRDALFWECHGRIKHAEHHEPLLTSEESNWNRVLKLSTDEQAFFAHEWLNLVEDYSEMNLTQETDRLIAIQGLVDLMCKNIPESQTYIAGLFRSNLVDGLAWSNQSREAKKIDQFPSWSWASLSFGGVYYHSLPKWLVKIVAVDPFAVIGPKISHTRGRLTIKAFVWRVRFEQNPTMEEPDSNFFEHHGTLHGYPVQYGCCFDGPGSMPRSACDVTLVEIGCTTRMCLALILLPTGSEYRRIGIALIGELRERELLTGVDQETLSIV